MNKFLSVMLFLLLSCNAWSVETALYLSDKSKYNTNDARKVLTRVIKDKSKAILFMIHGRGKHPEKGLSIIPEIEERYGVRVILFHWSSWINNYTRPVQNARDAGSVLLEVLMQFDDFKTNNPKIMERVRFSMMTHSMGSIVIESMLKEYKRGSFSRDLFSNLIINQSDSEVVGHSLWLSKADFQEDLYVTYSNKDYILKISQLMDTGKRLGMGIEVKNQQEIFYPWASQANYVDLAKVTKKSHKTYLPKQKKKYKTAINFYNKVLGGEKFQLNSSNNVFPKESMGDGFNKPRIFEFRK